MHAAAAESGRLARRIEARHGRPVRAENAGRQMLSSGQPGALPTLYGPPPLVVRTVYSTMDTCMQSKGYRWTSPR